MHIYIYIYTYMYIYIRMYISRRVNDAGRHAPRPRRKINQSALHNSVKGDGCVLSAWRLMDVYPGNSMSTCGG